MIKKFLCLFFAGSIALSCIAQKNPCNPTGDIAYSSMPQDTTIILPQGTRLTFNRCEYFDIKDCLGITEAYDVESMRRQNLTTLDRNGNALLSAGMFCVYLSNDCQTHKECFEVPVKVSMPLPGTSASECGKCEQGTFRLYNSRDGFWSDSSRNFKVVERDGRNWLEFTIACANICYNGDCIVRTGGKTKIKVKKIHRLEKVEISMECPAGILKYEPKKGRRKVIARLPCMIADRDKTKVVATGYDRAGNPVVSSSISVSELKHGWGRRKCRGDDKMGKRSKKGSFYKKYIIRL